jgi:hypothetical protein
MTDEISARYGRTPPDDIKTAVELRAATKSLTAVHPKDKDRLDAAARVWLDRAVKARTEELSDVPKWDLAGFDRSAPGRKALAEALPECRPEVVRADDEWGRSAALLPAGFGLLPYVEGERPPVDWRAVEKNLLALNSLDASDGRFKSARASLFERAHTDTKSLIAAHLDAGRYEQAFGLARKHMVEWNATATALGEVKKLDALREYCESLARLYDASAKPTEPAEIAPPPRTKPE